MNTRVSLCLLFGMLFASDPATGFDTPVLRQAFTLTNQTDDGWTFHLVPQSQPIGVIPIGSSPHLLFMGGGDGIEPGDAGKPQLPVEVLSVGIPFGARVTAELADPLYEVMENQLVAPSPRYTYTDRQEAVPEYEKDPTAYGLNRFFPSEQILVERPVTLRQQRIATLRIWPYQYNPSTKALRRLVQGTLRVRVVDPTPAGLLREKRPSLPDPEFEQTYRSLLSNYEQAKRWREDEPRRTTPPPDSTRSWFETGRIYCRIPIAVDGWYRVTRTDLISAGFDLSLLNPSTMKVFARGRELPIAVIPDTTVEFYAYHNYGDSTYIDYYTDTSAYWLTWGGSDGLRFTDAVPAVGAPTFDVQSAMVTRHYESNTSYWSGQNPTEAFENDQVPGEGWAWQFFSPNSEYTYPFVLDSIESQTLNSSLRVGVVSTRATTATPNHIARFWLNDSLVGEMQFQGRVGATYQGVVPTRWLRSGTNNLKIRSIPTSASSNEFYLDWFEVDFPRRLIAKDNQLLFLSPSSSGSGPASITMRGFSSSHVDVYDLTTRRKLINAVVSGDSLAGFSAAFQDTFSVAHWYLAATRGSAFSPAPISQKVFSDLRANATGADYIIISHKNFLAAAQQLAAHRQTTNGVRSTVVDAQDIYDEFNYGVKNAVTLKTFLHYAYQHWTPPRPAYLLFFGDASWDHHRYLPSSIKADFIPAYGFPSGDNWYGCFNPDTTFFPSLFIGRLPVETPAQAQQVLNKVVGYDSYALSEWNKNFMFISGGIDESEQLGFNYLTNQSITSGVLPPPIGGTAFGIYKSTPGVVDGEHKQEMKDHVKNGVSFVNFLGHSGGGYWGVDIGPPEELENTNGKLPFVSSVSCNVGAFATPSGSNLAETFVLADNRAAIAVWASSSLGFALLGEQLVDHFLTSMRVDSLRAFGPLTTRARFRLWQYWGSSGVPMVKLNPLLGDPLSRFALPLSPDLALAAEDIASSNPTPTLNDSVVTIKVKVHNYGLMPVDSVAVTVNDVFDGHPRTLESERKLAPTRHRDSLTIRWIPGNEVGRHTMTANLDPLNVMQETNETNNSASFSPYVYANLISVVKPLNNMVLPAGPQHLVVTSPVGLDSAGFLYAFELDTAATFDSPWRIASGPIIPGPVSGEWTTPALSIGQVYFWRARTSYSGVVGNWVTSCFSVSNELPSSSLTRWRQSSRKQFARESLSQLSLTDSGAVISPQQPVVLYCRSLGNRNNINTGAYSVIQVNDAIIYGYWWVLGNSFFAVRVNQFTGAFDLRSFPVSSNPAQSDTMAAWLNATPVGDYVGISVIYNGQTNVRESLYVALERLGSTLIRGVQAGASWSFIGRKGASGPGMPALERQTNDSAVVQFTIPNAYRAGSGMLQSRGFGTPASWDSLHWRWAGGSSTSARVALVGRRTTGQFDTLRIIPKDSLDVSLGSLNPITASPRYVGVYPVLTLSSADAASTPLFKEWWIDLHPPADLAISARTVGGTSEALKGLTQTLPVTVHNLGYGKSDSARVYVSAYDKYNKLREVASATLDSIVVDGSRTVTVVLSSAGLPRRANLQVVVAPFHKGKDLVAENNIAYCTIETPASIAPNTVDVFADGVRIMDGDFIAATPTITVRPQSKTGTTPLTGIANLLVDRHVAPSREARTLSKPALSSDQSQGGAFSFAPQLAEGEHELGFQLHIPNQFGETDTIEHSVRIRVLSESKLFQVFNYPNPFSSDTYFTFMVSGSRAPDDVTIRVFTIAGRKLREILVPGSELKVGFNRIHWDGRDNDGDEIANGYYLYQVSVRSQGKTDSAILKLTKVK